MTTTKNSEYFERATRSTTGDKFYRLTSDAPDYMKDFVRSIHFDLFDGCLPNDWIYETVAEAFEALEEDKLENCSIESDVYNSDLLKWMENPFADGYCKQAELNGLVADSADIYTRIGWGQYNAKLDIYDAVNAFNGDDYDD